MRLIQRLAAGMCETRANALRAQKREIGQAARALPWAKLPIEVRRHLTAARVLHLRLEEMKAEIARAGFTTHYDFSDVRHEEPITYKDAQDRERKAAAVVEKRIETIQRRKDKALRDTLGMSEKDGKAYLVTLEKDLGAL